MTTRNMRFLEPESYQPEARRLYETIAANIRAVLPAAVIEHIGSSSISGAISKGDLDLFVSVGREDFSKAISAIEGLGFRIKQDTLRTDELCPFESCDSPMAVGIQLIVRGSRFEFFRRFRDLLNGDPVLLKRYNRLKRDSETLDEHRYRARKSDFIEAMLAETASAPAGQDEDYVPPDAPGNDAAH